MSTTVTYKGNTLTTVDNQTRTLQTSGKYMEDDLTLVDVSGGGGDDPALEPPLKDVVFIDYDGEVVAQYTKAEFLALSAMPSNPSHIGLTAQGWNWSLSDAKTFIQTHDALCIGQMYKTTDGKTRIYISINEHILPYPLTLRFATTVKNGATIAWGDGDTTVTTGNANSTTSYTHTYSTVGDYVITIEVTSGTMDMGYNGSNGHFFGPGTPSEIEARMAYGVSRIEVGDDVTIIRRQALTNALSLESITLPNTVKLQDTANNNIFGSSKLKALVIPNTEGFTSLGGLLTGQCTAIKYISIPKTITAIIGQIAPSNQYSLRMITFPDVTSIANYAICYSSRRLERFVLGGTYTSIPTSTLREAYNFSGSITIPSTVTEIKDYAFTNTMPSEYHLLPTSPPTLANARAIGRSSGYTKVYVPYSADHSVLNAYTSASQWSSLASYIEEEPQ